MASALRVFGNSLQIQPRTILSVVKNGNRPGLPRRSTIICCRNTRISASIAARGRTRSTTIPTICLQRCRIRRRIIRSCVYATGWNLRQGQVFTRLKTFPYTGNKLGPRQVLSV